MIFHFVYYHSSVYKCFFPVSPLHAVVVRKLTTNLNKFTACFVLEEQRLTLCYWDVWPRVDSACRVDCAYCACWHAVTLSLFLWCSSSNNYSQTFRYTAVKDPYGQCPTTSKHLTTQRHSYLYTAQPQTETQRHPHHKKSINLVSAKMSTTCWLLYVLYFFFFF